MTAKQKESLELIRSAGVPVPVGAPNPYVSRFRVHPQTARVLVKLGYAEWVRGEKVDETLHVKAVVK